jgi:hypothetical protein
MSPSDVYSRFGRYGGPRSPDDPQFQLRFPPDAWKWLAAGAIAVLVIWGVFTSFYTVQPEQRAVVKRFGAVVYQTAPGLHFKIPFGIDDAELVPTERVLRRNLGSARRSSSPPAPAMRLEGWTRSPSP